MSKPTNTALKAATAAVEASRIDAMRHPSGRAIYVLAEDEAYDVLMASGYPTEVERLRELVAETQAELERVKVQAFEERAELHRQRYEYERVDRALTQRNIELAELRDGMDA
jgi:hypothetical protein